MDYNIDTDSTTDSKVTGDSSLSAFEQAMAYIKTEQSKQNNNICT